MYKRFISPTLLAITLILLLSGGVVLAAIMSSDNYSLSKLTLEGSGGSMSSDNYRVNLTVGQVGVGSASSENYQVGFGFWPGAVRGGGNVYLPLVLKKIG